jgi:hypothetical protein
VWTDTSRTTERCRFSYPRQQEAPYYCIADFFRPIESDEVDYAAFHIVTMGSPVSEAAAELFAANRYQDYMMLHGIGVEMAEALAEYWHHRIRTEWDLCTKMVRRLLDSSDSNTEVVDIHGDIQHAPIWKTTHSLPNCSKQDASALSLVKKRDGSISPNRPRQRSSATTRSPSTSSRVNSRRGR